jgi:threonine synthase
MDSFSCPACGPVDAADPFLRLCPGCGGPVFVTPGGGRRSIRESARTPLERYAEFLPLSSIDRRLSLGEGATPLLRLTRLGSNLGLPGLYAKDETRNPTGSFKDRGTVVAVMKAVASGLHRIGTVSTGNMAVSTAAYGARAGLETFVLLKEGTSDAAVRAAAVYGPRLIRVDGDYGRLFHRSLEIGRALGLPFVNSVDPFRMEGYKVTGYEIYEQLGRRAPAFVLVPVSAGGHILGLMRAFEDLEKERLIAGVPTFVGVQAEGCAPLVRAFEAGQPSYERLDRARTVAHAISNPAPPAGNAVLRAVRGRNGLLFAVSDEEMLAARSELAAAEGLVCQPESATVLAALPRLVARGAVASGDEVVLVLTGRGHRANQATGPLSAPVRRMPLDGLEREICGLLGPKV